MNVEFSPNKRRRIFSLAKFDVNKDDIETEAQTEKMEIENSADKEFIE